MRHPCRLKHLSELFAASKGIIGVGLSELKASAAGMRQLSHQGRFYGVLSIY
ncbi:hypothetical protein IC617_10765 [Neiella sp. HB171785]|uniref:Uncharacterized protein n=1 Tax=Neiella litorisoli TaxID=2771431 RepID=A0A8J6UM49_9GAMM|nr:hypothetical protein [Neiella litorisoli]MBD1389910.1 hypothetical protein [Neiella litorisoli]